MSDDLKKKNGKNGKKKRTVGIVPVPSKVDLGNISPPRACRRRTFVIFGTLLVVEKSSSEKRPKGVIHNIHYRRV